MYEEMNEMQRRAVERTEGPVLILAGAGSGKTRVLTHRTAYLIEEKGVSPYNILAITFTNKAAGEMRERIDRLVGCGSESIWVSTFHSACVRILRRHIDRIGYATNFTIYDSDDQKQLMKDICKRLNVDTKIYKEKMFLNAISRAKDELTSPDTYRQSAQGDYGKQRIAEVYTEYQMMLHKNNALDFDDLIMKTVELFQTDPEVLGYYQERFRYIMVDEYQDTNTAQFNLIRLLAGKYQNLCVVGDDDQSIYKFRGANIWNILNFEHYFPDAAVIKLEQNYRSTQKILDAANGVIANNEGRKEKALWTENEPGDQIVFRQFDSAPEESEYIASDIKKKVASGKYRYQDCAVLYRTNAQSRLFEERFVVSNIPYRIVGGINFYARREIKDLLAYLKTIDNARDDLAVRRIINVPKRGIGATTLGKVQDYANINDMSFYNALRGAEDIPGIGRAAVKIGPFVTFIQAMRSKTALIPLSDLLQEIIDTTGYVRELEAEGTDEAKARIENIGELQSKVRAYEDSVDEPTLSGFLEEVALVADIDSLTEDSDYVVLMTLHSAKGLEFPQVYLAGMEDGLFPSYMSITGDNPKEELEEERRLAYVGITRAMKNLTITCARMRMVRGETQTNKVSRFVREIPQDILATQKMKKREPAGMPDHRLSPAQKAREIFNAKPYAAQAGTYGYGSRAGGAADGTAGYAGGAADGMTGRTGGYAAGVPDNWSDGGMSGNAGTGVVPGGGRTATMLARQGTGVGVGTVAARQGTGAGAGTVAARQGTGAGTGTVAAHLGYGIGDRVAHTKFGSGVVTNIVSGGRDYEVTVQFDSAGVKKMFAAFAKLKKQEM